MGADREDKIHSGSYDMQVDYLTSHILIHALYFVLKWMTDRSKSFDFEQKNVCWSLELFVELPEQRKRNIQSCKWEIDGTT